MTKQLAATAAFLVLALAAVARAERPFFTEEAETLEPGRFTVDFGVSLREDPQDFGIEARDRQYNLGEIRFSFGLGQAAELQVSGEAVRLIDRNGETSSNSGDWVFGTKIWMLREREGRPSFSFLYEVKLPNGSDEDGGATDETDFFGYLVMSKGWGRNVVHGNLGLGILGNPFANSSQNDIFVLRVAWEHRLTDNQILGLEALVEGGPQENDDPRSVRALYSHRMGPWVVHGGVGVGLGDEADDLRLDMGVRRKFSLWRPGEIERRNDW